MAIKSLAWMVRVFEPPVYCYHEIVHNQVVVDRFRQLGVVFVDDVLEVPPGRPLMLSAHGSAPEVVAAAREAGGVVVNAVCPLVTKVHHEVKLRASKGYSVLYVGHRGHEEAVGTMAVAPGSIFLVESVDEVLGVPDPGGPVAFLAQTTLAVDEWRSILEAAQERWPELWVPPRSDLGFATTNRQAALRAVAGRCDAMVVIGSANSSNTLALVRTAKAAGCPRVVRVNQAAEVPDDLAGTVGVIAGASAPESLVQDVVAALAPRVGAEEVVAVPEDEYFPLPRELRELLRNLAGALAVLGFAPPAAEGGPGPGRGDPGATAPATRSAFDGRDVPAAHVLAALG